MLEETYGHTPLEKMFDKADVYGVGFDKQRAARKPLRLGIIGAGGVAQSKHIPALLRLRTIWEPVTLAAVSSVDERSGKRLEQSYNCRWYADYQQMLQREKLDGVLVAGPSELHVEHAIACIQAGIAALVEKPPSRSLSEAARLCRLAEERNVPLMTVANKRYSPPYRGAKRFVREGPLKDPAMFCGKFNLGYDYVANLLQDGTIHLLDLARYFMGDVRAVSAVGVNKYARNPSAPFDNAVITLAFVSGSIGSIYTASSALSLKPWERVEIYANKCWLAVEDQYELALFDSEAGPAKSWRPVVPNTLIFDEEFGGYMGQLENFLQVIRGEESPLVTGWDGYRALELCTAAQQAIESRQTIALPLPEAASVD